MNEIETKVVERLTGKKAEGFFPITSVCKDDLRHIFKNDQEALRRIDELDEGDMKYLAEKLASDYCEQLYWSSLRILFKDIGE